MSTGALDGLRVIELGGGVSAAYCAKLFADLGADVLKVEPPRSGDPTRGWGQPRTHEHMDTGSCGARAPARGNSVATARDALERSGAFFFLNTNKRSLELDLDAPVQRDQLSRLVESADLLIENFTPPRMRDWGLDYDALAKSNPDLVMISITPFGQTGPCAEWKGCDLNAFHFSSAGNRYCGRPDQEPLKHGTFSADFYGATAAATWGLAAVYGRDRVGGGQHIDVSTAETIAATVVGAMAIGSYAQDGAFDRRTGVGMPMAAPATLLPARDGYVWIIALEPGQWSGLIRALDHPDWMTVEMFEDPYVRGQNADLIYSMLAEWTRTRSKAEIMDRCQREGCPATAVWTIDEAVAHPHTQQREFLRSIEHPVIGRVRTLGPAFRMSETSAGPQRPAPRLGEHNHELRDGGRPWPLTGERAAPGRRSSADTGAPPRSSGTHPLASSPDAPQSASPLAGVRVANFGWVWAGPVVGQTLGFLGAEVYKLESRERLDFMRTLPPFLEGVPGPDRCLSLHAAWAGNRSVTVNLKTEEGRALAREIVRCCDVVVENFGPGVMASLGLDFERLKQEQPGLIMCSLPAAGLTGPLKDIRTYGLSLTSLTGLDSVTGYGEGPPIPFEAPYSDPYTGILAAFSVIAALQHRDRTGQGQQIELSQQEAVMQMMGPAFVTNEIVSAIEGLGETRRSARPFAHAPIGNQHPLAAAAPHGVFPCRGDDRWISLSIEGDHAWQQLQHAMGQPEWSRSPAYADHAGRLQHAAGLAEALSAWTRQHDASKLAESLQARGLSAAPVLGVPDLLAHPHYQARGTFQRITRPDGVVETIYGAYVKTSRSRPEIRPGPDLGSHNEAVYRGLLGLSADRYQELVDTRVIY